MKIALKNIFTLRKNLGHCKSPCDSSYSAHLSALLSKADLICSTIHQCSPNGPTTLMLYKAVLLLAIQYPLTQSFLSSARLLQQELKYLPHIFSLCSYARSSAKTISNISLWQGRFYSSGGHHWQRLCYQFLKHWRSHDIAGKLLQTAL